jgi:hypothetical protein
MAAVSGSEGIFRVRHFRERERARVGGAGRDVLREANRERRREAGRLDERERQELVFMWSGVESALGVRSPHGAVEEKLLRSPPSGGALVERDVAELIRKRGRLGVEREKVVEVVSVENGATRHEVRLALRRMVGAGHVEFFVAEESKKRACVCRLPYGEVEGESPGAPGAPHSRRECRCGAGTEDAVPVEKVRLSEAYKKRAPEPALKPAERWARKDAELERYCRELVTSETVGGGGSRLPPHVRTGGAERARGAFRRIAPEFRRVIERAYGAASAPGWVGVLSAEASRLASSCPTVERARQEAGREQAAERGLGPEDAEVLDRSTFAADVMRQRLDRQPEGVLDRIRWAAAREKFIEAVERESAEILRKAVDAYRAERGT